MRGYCQIKYLSTFGFITLSMFFVTKSKVSYLKVIAILCSNDKISFLKLHTLSSCPFDSISMRFFIRVDVHSEVSAEPLLVTFQFGDELKKIPFEKSFL